ncbi:MAG TPA: hypothetical protein VK029_07500 [Pseudogracilibacillus sp.]|nr:hypothetical protein [Pseudogracilibacillus sp.]
MLQGTRIKAQTNVALPFTFIIYALFAFLFAQLIILLQTDVFMSGIFRIPPIWMASHLLVLGFALMVVFGAMYQLVPVALLTPIYSERLGFVQLGVTLVGVTMLAIFLGIAPQYALYGGIITVIGVSLFLLNMFLTILQQKNKNIITAFVIAALLSLFVTIVCGLLLVINIVTGFLRVHDPLLFSHMTFGLVGTFSLIIFAFSYQLVPMFSLAHGHKNQWAKTACILYVSGMMTTVVSFWFSNENMLLFLIGNGLLLLGFCAFLADIYDMLKNRLRKRLDKSFSFSILAICFGFVCHVFAFGLAALQITSVRTWGILIAAYTMTWIIFSILGYLNKIVPVLWWTHKYAEQIGKEKVPTLQEMTNEQLNTILFLLFIISFFLFIVGLLLTLKGVAVFAQFIFTLTAFTYVASLLRVFSK